MEISTIQKQLTLQYGIESCNIIASDQGQTHEGYFIGSDYFLKVYKKKDQYDNALIQSNYGPKIIAHGIIETQPYILYEQIHGTTVAELLPGLSNEDQNTVFKIITQILKQIHQEEKQEDGRHRIHGDYHIGNILVDKDRRDINNYTVIDWDTSCIGSFEDEYGVMVETIAIPVAMVSEALESYYQDIQLLNWRNVINEIYPEFVVGYEEIIKIEGIKRADMKFAFKNGTNARANAMGNKIIDFINQI